MDEDLKQQQKQPNLVVMDDAPPPPPVDTMIGQIIDARYEVLAQLGKGGMGTVYKVRDISSGTEYALKMISPELAEKRILAKRLEHEAIAAKTLTHERACVCAQAITTDLDEFVAQSQHV